MIGSAYSEIAEKIQQSGPEGIQQWVADVPDKDFLLLDAAYALDEAVVAAALAAGANPNAQSESVGAQGAETALHRAVRGHGDGAFEAVAKMLLDADAFTEAKNAARDTPIHAACYEGEARVMTLIRLGVKPDTLDDAGQTLMHKAVLLNMPDLAQLLLEKGVQVDVRDIRNQTPLLVATKERRIPFIKFLLEHGADMNAADSKGESAKRVALEKEDGELEMIFTPLTAASVHTPKAKNSLSGCSTTILAVLLIAGSLAAVITR
jgi:ankyrin repeat protein